MLEEVVSSLCHNMRQQLYPVGLVPSLLQFFSVLLESRPHVIIMCMKSLFEAIVVYWKTSLFSILEFVTQCKSLPGFGECHLVILRTLLFILNDDTVSNLMESMIVCFGSLLQSRLFSTWAKQLRFCVPVSPFFSLLSTTISKPTVPTTQRVSGGSTCSRTLRSTRSFWNTSGK